MSVTHKDLCKITAEWAIKKAKVGVYDYQSFATAEFPDVLMFHSNHSTLYEIKVSRADFLSDKNKECRMDLRPHTVEFKHMKYKERKKLSDSRIKLVPTYYRREPTRFINQQPHLGVYRYYVCPYGMIQPEEVELFGLYWYREKDGKFFNKKKSEKFKRNLYEENAILVHAVRRQCNTGNDKLLVKEY